MRYSKLLLLALVLATTTATLFAFKLSAPAAASLAPGETLSASAKVNEQTLASDAPTATDEYVHRAELWPHLRSAMRLMGDRLERPGKERLVMEGTLQRGGEASSIPLRLIREFPGRLRVEEQEGTQRNVTVFESRFAQAGEHSRREADLIETLLFDTAEHFFTAHAKGAATRHLGNRFRLEADNSDAAYDVFEVVESVSIGANARRQTRTYYLNSDTQLLELVRYELERDGLPLRVEVRLGDWRRVQGQMMPHHVERRENEVVMFSLDINSITVSPRAQDNAFSVMADN